MRKRRHRDTTGLRRTLRELRESLARYEKAGKRMAYTDTESMFNWGLNDGGYLRVRYAAYTDGSTRPIIERINTYGVHVGTYRLAPRSR